MQVAPPGAAWSYNNAGFSIAGRVIEVVTGKTINARVRDLVFQPLGLEHAGTTAGEFIVAALRRRTLSTRDGVPGCSGPFVPSVERHGGRRRRCRSTTCSTYARFHMGDGAAANGSAS